MSYGLVWLESSPTSATLAVGLEESSSSRSGASYSSESTSASRLGFSCCTFNVITFLRLRLMRLTRYVASLTCSTMVPGSHLAASLGLARPAALRSLMRTQTVSPTANCVNATRFVLSKFCL